MRNISPAAMNYLSQTLGLEPVNLVRVFWTNSISVLYGDRQFANGIVGKLLELGNLENVVNISKSSNTQAVSLKIDDSDGEIKNIFDNNDIHKRTVYVYQWFLGLPLSDAFIIFEGEIASPISWKEGERTISFDCVSKIEDQEIGFSAEEGDFEYIPPPLIGAAWPLPFGSPQWVPSLAINTIAQGLTNEGVGLGSGNYNTGLLNNDNKALADASFNFYDCLTKALHCYVMAFTVAEEGQVPVIFLSGGFDPPSQGATLRDQWNDSGDKYVEQANQYLAQIHDINNKVANVNDKNKFTVQNGSTFPQGVTTSININGAVFTGQFSGNEFTVLSSTNPYDTSNNLLSGPLTVNDSQVATAYQASLNEQRFFYAVGGSAVQGVGESLFYIISLLEVQVQAVLAKYNGVVRGVPPQYYQVSYVNFGNIQATYLTVPIALSVIDPLWTDEIFTNIISPVGPNAVDIMIWLIQTYTVHTFDVASFADVRNKVNPFPMNFVYFTRPNILKALQEIAYQARCALWYKEGLFYLKFLPDTGSSVATFTEDDVEDKTLEITCTDTEELVTKYTAEWKLYENQSGFDKVIWRYNIQKYGIMEKTDQYYAYNNVFIVEHVSMFWLIRYSNTWKRLKFSTFLTKLAVETFDSVTIDFADPLVANGPVVGIVENALYNSADNRIEMTVWLPIRFGEMNAYPFAYPYAIDPTLIFPDPIEFANTPPTTGQQAAGQLYKQTTNQPKKTRSNSSFGGLNGSDSAFQEPVFDTALDTNEIDNSGNPNQGNSYKQHQIKPVKDVNVAFDSPGTWPGIINGQVNGNLYSVKVYFSGINNTPTSVNVQQIQINTNDVIPAGTACIVMRNKLLKGIDPTTRIPTYISEYTMQVPVYVKSINQSVNPPAVPVSDPGTDGSTTETTTTGTPGDFESTDGGDQNLGTGGDF